MNPSRPPIIPPSAPNRSSKKRRKNGSGIGKWVFVLFMLIVIYIGYQSILVKKDNGVEQKPKVTQAKNPAPASTWTQSYLTTFNYYGQRINVRSVTVRNLNETTASVAYIVSISSPKSKKWVTNKKLWKIGRNNKSVKAQRISSRTVNGETVATIRFRYPTESLENGGFLQINIPQVSKKDPKKYTRQNPVKIGIEIPLSHRGIKEEDGLGGI